jgi:protein-disulfide isomerase
MRTVLFVALAAGMVFGQVPTVSTAPPAAAPSPAKPKAEASAFDKGALELYLRHLELYLPTVTAKIDDAQPSKALPGFFDVWVHWLAPNGATKDEVVYVSKDGKTFLQGTVYDMNKSPFQSNLEKLKTDGQPMVGAKDAPVTMVVFSDFQCPVCKEEAKILRENLAKEFPDKVRMYFEDFPLESIHNWARIGADAGRCVYKQNPAKFWDYFDWMYDQQQNIGLDNVNEKLQLFATEKGVDGMQLGKCMDTKASDGEVAHEMEEGKALQITATPTIFINGRKLEGGLPWATLDTLIKMELERQTQLKEMADKCCEVGMPKVVK